jgi:hypothetical protein
MIILDQSCLKKNQYLSYKMKFLLGIVMVSMVVISRGYSGSLTSSLTKPITLKRMDTLEDLEKSDSEILFFEGTATYNWFVKSKDPIELKVLEKYRSQKHESRPKTGDFTLAVYNKKTVIFAHVSHIEYCIMARFSTQSGKSTTLCGYRGANFPNVNLRLCTQLSYSNVRGGGNCEAISDGAGVSL